MAVKAGSKTPDGSSLQAARVSPAAARALAEAAARRAAKQASRPREIGGRDGLEPTRYGDWEVNGRCVDF